MENGEPHHAYFWPLVIVTTIFLSLEPALFLVVLALGLSAITLWWIVLLIGMLIWDAFGGAGWSPRCAIGKQTSDHHPL